MVKRLEQPEWGFITPAELQRRLLLECDAGEHKHGKLQSAHEVFAVILGELQEFWESVRDHDPDPQELLQIAAVARRGILDLTEAARNGVIR
jgi:hypothetical protein